MLPTPRPTSPRRAVSLPRCARASSSPSGRSSSLALRSTRAASTRWARRSACARCRSRRCVSDRLLSLHGLVLLGSVIALPSWQMLVERCWTDALTIATARRRPAARLAQQRARGQVVRRGRRPGEACRVRPRSGRRSALARAHRLLQLVAGHLLRGLLVPRCVCPRRTVLKRTEDRLSSYYNAQPHDRGLHLFVGSERHRGAARVDAWMTSVIDYIFRDEARTERIFIEPHWQNEKVIGHLEVRSRSSSARVKADSALAGFRTATSTSRIAALDCCRSVAPTSTLHIQSSNDHSCPSPGLSR